jgi:hypothetical protein
MAGGELARTSRLARARDPIQGIPLKGIDPFCPRLVTLKEPRPPLVWSHVGRRAMATNRSASYLPYPCTALTVTL